jgi:hypothetical protein
MNAVYPYQKSPRCSATSKRTKQPCMAPAVNGWTVCRFHGGAWRRAKRQKERDVYRHGRYTHEAPAERRMIRNLLRQSAKSLNSALTSLNRR